MIKPFSIIALAALTTAWLALGSTPPAAAELVMFEQKGCAWCARFNEEIAPAYAHSEEGKIAPLRRIDIHASFPPDLREINVERFTPTFVLVEEGKEFGRLRGYPGDEFFWFLINEMIADLPEASRAKKQASRPDAVPAL